MAAEQLGIDPAELTILAAGGGGPGRNALFFALADGGCDICDGAVEISPPDGGRASFPYVECPSGQHTIDASGHAITNFVTNGIAGPSLSKKRANNVRTYIGNVKAEGNPSVPAGQIPAITCSASAVECKLTDSKSYSATNTITSTTTSKAGVTVKDVTAGVEKAVSTSVSTQETVSLAVGTGLDVSKIAPGMKQSSFAAYQKVTYDLITHNVQTGAVEVTKATASLPISGLVPGPLFK